jgi:hypothetical protein
MNMGMGMDASYLTPLKQEIKLMVFAHKSDF